MPNSHRASIISNPLFIIVAESIVIRLPIFQFGCASACSTETLSRSFSGVFRKGPPDAVSTRRVTSLCAPARRHWCTALCSLSTGRSSFPAQPCRQFIRLLRIANRHNFRFVPLDLASQFIEVAARRERNYSKSLVQRVDDGKALATNRAGRTQYRELLHEVLFPFCALW